jgi:hypothetical protein
VCRSRASEIKRTGTRRDKRHPHKPPCSGLSPTPQAPGTLAKIYMGYASLPRAIIRKSKHAKLDQTLASFEVPNDKSLMQLVELEASSNVHSWMESAVLLVSLQIQCKVIIFTQGEFSTSWYGLLFGFSSSPIVNVLEVGGRCWRHQSHRQGGNSGNRGEFHGITQEVLAG